MEEHTRVASDSTIARVRWRDPARRLGIRVTFGPAPWPAIGLREAADTWVKVPVGDVVFRRHCSPSGHDASGLDAADMGFAPEIWMKVPAGGVAWPESLAPQHTT